jgi:ABC-type dipeptide/oligopeptide/nickel transport system ATPase component
VTARIVLGLLQETRTARINGTVQFDGSDINSMSARDRAVLRGTEMSMIFQDPTSSLNPMFTIGNQFTEVLRRRDPKLSKAASHARATALLDEVAIPDPARVLDAYPFQLSGGMNQRVMIAMALANKPKLLLADEPGTALDVSVQAQTLTMMRDMVEQNGTSVLFISHNLGVVREFADRVYVIYRGNIVEDGPTVALFANPQHAYTRALMSAVPRITGVGLPEVPEVSDDFLAPRIRHGDAS